VTVRGGNPGVEELGECRGQSAMLRFVEGVFGDPYGLHRIGVPQYTGYSLIYRLFEEPPYEAGVMRDLVFVLSLAALYLGSSNCV
jgi:hypothetical protein